MTYGVIQIECKHQGSSSSIGKISFRLNTIFIFLVFLVKQAIHNKEAEEVGISQKVRVNTLYIQSVVISNTLINNCTQENLKLEINSQMLQT